MRALSYLLVGLLCVGFSSCSTQKRVPKNASISFKRTACFGTCPIYTLTVDSKGNATFLGERFTDKIGEFTKHLSREETKALFSTLNEANWDNFQDKYDANVSDLPSTIFAFNYKRINKKVVVTGEHPEGLIKINEALIAVAEADGWTSAIAK